MKRFGEATWRKVRQLVAVGADVDEQRGEHGATALHAAAFKGHVEAMRVLVGELGADKDSRALLGLTQLARRGSQGAGGGGKDVGATGRRQGGEGSC
jgi:ankyrin repeat protein